jgi:zinc/manganese transport system substrate-binding protein
MSARLNRTFSAVALLLALGATAPAGAQQQDGGKLVVVATLPYLADIARQVGGDEVEASSLLPAGTDPHNLTPTPALSVAVAKADVFLENGFQLELWAERVLDGARNQDVRAGAPGHCYAGQGIMPLDVPAEQTRAMGDVHPGGNPHLWGDPLNLKVVARNIEKTLGAVRPAAAAKFEANRRDFERRLDDAYYGADLVKILGSELLDRLQRQGRLKTFLTERQYQGKPLREKAGGWLGRALALGDLHIITYHAVWSYLTRAFGFTVTGTIEEKPGIPPSPSHLEQLEARAHADGTKIVDCSPFYPLSRAQEVAERIGGVCIQLPTQPGEAEGAHDVFSMYDTIFTMLEAASGHPAPSSPGH